jgi:16S rRNA (uracil1498-N3)-methyltransferase
MAPPRFEDSAGARRFLLEVTPDQGVPRLAPGDLQHALRVLRLGVGDHLIGLDGQGQAWPLEVLVAEKRSLELGPAGPKIALPAPGEAGSGLPWIELHAPLPKAGRAEELVSTLTQLGLARLTPLVTERTAGQAREVSEGRLARLIRAAQEALKQSGRLWMPEFGPLGGLQDLPGPAESHFVLSPSAQLPLKDALVGLQPGIPISLVAGPEGGLTEAEEASLVASGATLVGLGPHILRIETAATAAVAIAAHCAPPPLSSPG